MFFRQTSCFPISLSQVYFLETTGSYPKRNWHVRQNISRRYWHSSSKYVLVRAAKPQECQFLLENSLDRNDFCCRCISPKTPLLGVFCQHIGHFRRGIRIFYHLSYYSSWKKLYEQQNVLFKKKWEIHDLGSYFYVEPIFIDYIMFTRQ